MMTRPDLTAAQQSQRDTTLEQAEVPGRLCPESPEGSTLAAAYPPPRKHPLSPPSEADDSRDSCATLAHKGS